MWTWGSFLPKVERAAIVDLSSPPLQRPRGPVRSVTAAFSGGRMGPAAERILRLAIAVVYARRGATFAVLIAFTAVMLAQALRLQPDAGYEKQIPLQHPYMQVFKKYEKAFGGANLVTIALQRRDGDIYEERFLEALRQATDEVFFLPGVDRSRVTSLFTPGVRYLEIVEGGFAGGDVVPRDYAPSPAMFALIRANVGKAGIIGRLVSNDQKGAMIVAELLEHHPVTGEDHRDRKSTRLNSSHVEISYAVFCLKKKSDIICGKCASGIMQQYSPSKFQKPLIRAGER